jgi:glutaredoxin
MHLVVYSKEGCPFCSLLKAELANRQIPYQLLDLSDDDVRASFYDNSGKKSVPQVYLTSEEFTLTKPSGESLGGWSDVSNRLNSLRNLIS